MRLLHIDAFTDRPFRGNPAAVCLLENERDADWMQHVAAEMNLSETAFLLHRSDGWSLRWFTPTVEVDLCGHATLASAHALWSEAMLDPNEMVRFHTRSGLLTAFRRDDLIELDFPVTPESPAGAPRGLLESLGVRKPKYVGKNKFDYLVEVESEDAVRAVNPDYLRLRELKARGVIVTSQGSKSGYDFVSRYFAPAYGIDEDPVTGSTHCCLTPYWAAKLGKTDLVAHQASKRGGILHVRLEGDRVRLGGRAITILRGRLEV